MARPPGRTIDSGRAFRWTGGVPTVASDVPRTGSATYRVLLTSHSLAPTGANGFTVQNADLTIDYQTGAVRGTLTATSTSSSTPARSVVFTLAGQVSTSSGRISGTITTQTGGTGQFSGDLNGPAALELGLAFTLQQSDEKIVGTLVGVKR